ncbi:unnamed protein product, partial [Prorocentrum cordatum]
GRCDEEFREMLSGARVMSKFGFLARVKGDEAKRRWVIDFQASSATSAAAKTRGVPLPTSRRPAPLQPRRRLAGRLPRSMGAGLGALKLFVHRRGDIQFGVEWLVADFSDAVWNAPLAVEERRVFVARFGVDYRCCRAAQGGRDGPCVWASVAALLARPSQAVFMGPSFPRVFGAAGGAPAGGLRRRFDFCRGRISSETWVDVACNDAGLESAWLRTFIPDSKARRGRCLGWGKGSPSA